MKRFTVNPIALLIAEGDKRSLLFVLVFAVMVYGGATLINYFFG